MTTDQGAGGSNPSRRANTDTAVELRPVDADNWRDCAALEPRADQRRYVAAVTYYLCLCHYGRVWQPLAVVHGGAVVGFVMWGVDETDGSHWIGGLVIAADQQRRGLGTATVTALVDHLANEHAAQHIALSYDADNHGARALYRGLGFTETGEVEDDEIVARLDLTGGA